LGTIGKVGNLFHLPSTFPKPHRAASQNGERDGTAQDHIEG
jgi:hypothetical protein